MKTSYGGTDCNWVRQCRISLKSYIWHKEASDQSHRFQPLDFFLPIQILRFIIVISRRYSSRLHFR